MNGVAAVMDEESAGILGRLADKAAIRGTLNRYSRGLDRHDLEIMGSVFSVDAVDNHGDFVGYAPEFPRWVNDLHERISVGHAHNLTTQLITLHSPQEAEAETYVIFVLVRHQKGLVHVGGGRYLDRIEKVDGLWRIALRRVVVEWRFDNAQAVPSDRLADFAAGRWDRADLSYGILHDQGNTAPTS